MSSFLAAIQAYGPRLVYNRTATTAEVAQTLSGRTGIKYGQVLMLLRELHEVLIQYGEGATPVELASVGRFRPTINRDGELRLAVNIAAELGHGINRLDRYHGEIINRANIGLDDAGYKALWDAAHPDDPLVLPARTAHSLERATSRAAKRVMRLQAKPAA